MAHRVDPLVASRIAILGASGSGKSRLARRLGELGNAPVLELDALYHQANWTPLDDDAFRSRVGAFVAGPRWICEGNYSVVRDVIWSRAELIIFLDFSRARVMGRLVRRTLYRVAFRKRLWNDNREQWRNLLSREPERNILLWSWRTHRRRRRDVPAMVTTLAPHATFVHVRTNFQCRVLYRRLAVGYASGPLPRSSSSHA
ncbi:MAG: adenylate kinase [Acidobacteriota bacterium]|nr:adenylate kinase [Acidobacteriota bacterium]